MRYTYLRNVITDCTFNNFLELCVPIRLGAKVLGTSVLEYRFCSTRQYSVLILLKSTCTRTCSKVLLKIKVLLTSTYKYFTSTSHL